ncbi:MAG: lysophospholipid acyltransferase family protein [Thermoflexaceae bacterium]|nr:lysophospholipid acyltransferase family protein [Thermoflexaceae bacterium]
MIRLIIFFFYALIIIIATPFLFLFMHLFWKNKPETKDRFCQKFVRMVFKHVLFIAGVHTTVKGLENIPEDTAVLYVGNHRSYFDILISYVYLKSPTGYIAKKEMEKIPLLRTWMRYIHCLFLDRTNPKEGLKTILAGIDNVKHGYSAFIFPEGTRAKTDEMLPFKEGSLKIAEKSGCPIIPVIQNNTSAAFEDHIPFFKKCHTVIEFGKPIIISELDAQDKKFLGAYTQKIIQEIHEKNKVLV